MILPIAVFLALGASWCLLLFVPRLERFLMLLRSTSPEEWERQGRISLVTYVRPWPAVAVALRFAKRGFREDLNLRKPARAVFRPLCIAAALILLLAVPKLFTLLESLGWVESETARWVNVIWIGS